MGNYFGSHPPINQIDRLCVLESRIAYLESQLNDGDGPKIGEYERIEQPQKQKKVEEPRARPSFHAELRKQLKKRRQHIEVAI